ncbi:MAG: nucleoside triphosphate pyrophosphohydrolase [Zetaproteobacteria bacterium]|nr:MAG: nucleoside triphosphate pyrophosphohydrolase [Zetaproteobacteria bacterium]
MNNQRNYNLTDLIKVMEDLRAPKTGCPWDIEQDFKTIIPYTLEEAYEVADAVDRGSMPDLREELGDLLFQSIYHAQMAAESGHFNIHDVIHDVTEKMISRHPHVFGNVKASSAADVDKIWEIQKEAEKNKNKDKDNSALDGVTVALPALLKAQKLQKKAAKVGFEWPDVSHVLDKLEEEILEMRTAIANSDTDNQKEELGDILFLLANYGRMLGINSEEALRQCNNKFERRFRGLETDIKNNGGSLLETPLEEMENAWNRQKNKE